MMWLLCDMLCIDIRNQLNGKTIKCVEYLSWNKINLQQTISSNEVWCCECFEHISFSSYWTYLLLLERTIFDLRTCHARIVCVCFECMNVFLLYIPSKTHNEEHYSYCLLDTIMFNCVWVCVCVCEHLCVLSVLFFLSHSILLNSVNKTTMH